MISAKKRYLTLPVAAAVQAVGTDYSFTTAERDGESFAVSGEIVNNSRRSCLNRYLTTTTMTH